MDSDLQEKYDAIRTAAVRRGRVLVAYSGGVDSGLVARIAHDALGDDALAVLADSESLARREVEAATVQAGEIGIPLRVIGTSELASEEYRKNPTNRCYFCREGLADELVPIARTEGFAAIADGINLSDLGDFRPGIRAMDESGFWHPLVDAGLAKSDVRALARGLGLSFWDKPSNACLSSRIPHGTTITVGLLRQVEDAEDFLRDRGFRQVRVRHDGETARIEVPPEDIPRLRSIEGEVADALRGIGYVETVIDPRGYRALG
jgi:uncharacterized protein